MAAILILAFALLIIANALLGTAGDAFRDAYTQNIVGDLTVGAVGESSFTIFGSDALLVGEYLIPPTLVEYDRLRAIAEAHPRVRASAGIVSATARVEIERLRETQVLFGVEFAEYGDLFPDLTVVAGGFPRPGQPGILIQEHRYDEISERRGSAPRIGSPVLITVAYASSFTIREVPLAGVYRYPVSDELLRRVALVDVDTARALNGHLYAAGESAIVPDEHREFAGSDLDDLFGTAESFAEDETIDPDLPVPTDDRLSDLEAFFSRDPATPDGTARDATRPVEGAWNYLLVALDRPDAERSVRSAFARAGFSEQNGFVVRNWRDSVGGTALLVRYLQVMVNIGVLFVAFGSAIIATNAIVLSVLERTSELGTMRALGASRARIAALITVETVIVVVGAAMIGIGIGVVGAGLLNAASVTPDNRYLRILFGGESLHASVGVALILRHVLASIGLGVAATVYPLKKAFSIDPARAIK